MDGRREGGNDDKEGRIDGKAKKGRMGGWGGGRGLNEIMVHRMNKREL